MADYFTRVELHGANGSDYDKLHAEMEKRGFYRAIKDGAGNHRQLPWAFYHSVAATQQSSVQRDEAGAAAKAVGRKSIIVVVESTDWAGRFEKP